MSVSVDAAAQLYQEAVRNQVQKSTLRYLIQSGLMVVAGIFAIVFPVILSEALVLVLGWLLILSGIAQATGLISEHRGPFAGLQIISVALALLIGFLILRAPAQSLVTFSLLIVVFFMIEGVSKIIWALTVRPLRGWFWVMLSGGLGVVLAVLLAFTIDTTSHWLLAVLLGVQLISIGASVGYLAWTIRQAATTTA
jgi:uncharacterized membrane protein HdeD (DUF308 family)